LSDRLRSAPNLTVAQHGTDHVNRRPPGQPPNEYPSATSAAEVGLAIAAARRRMAEAGLEPSVYVPPWNQVDETLLKALQHVGYRVYSAALDDHALPGLVQIGAQLDIMRWGRTPPRFRGEARIWDSLRRRLRVARRCGQFQRSVGLLTHHLAHDAAAWRFLETFLVFADDRFQWSTIETVAKLYP
jgi:predicted deacetylase